MNKLVIPLAASLVLCVAPAWADSDSETRVEERVEQKKQPLVDQEQTRSVETQTETNDGRSAKSIRQEDTVKTDGLGGTVEKKTEKKVETNE
jgi:hypothetical protein